jgi:two-component system, OmpR family, phosphate regulon sensor histidine kinase PhoR
MSSRTHSSADAKHIPAFTTALQPGSWPVTSTQQPLGACTFEAVLLAIAGHDLRQFLQGVQIAHDLLGRGLRSTSELGYLRSSQRALDQLNEQLSQLQTALRMQLHAKAVTLEPVRIQLLLKQACEENEEAARRKGINLRAVSSGAQIMSDSLLLGAALRNLVSNAIKYTNAGGRIIVGCRRRGRGVRIDVCDTGIGISGEQMPGIFEAFTRLDTERSDSLGIGLFIVRHAIGLLGHRIEVASTPERGSRFSISARSYPCLLETAPTDHLTTPDRLTS